MNSGVPGPMSPMKTWPEVPSEDAVAWGDGGDCGNNSCHSINTPGRDTHIGVGDEERKLMHGMK